MGRISRSANAMIFESHRLAYSWGTKNDAQNIWHAHRHVLDEDCLSTWRYGAVALWRCARWWSNAITSHKSACWVCLKIGYPKSGSWNSSLLNPWEKGAVWCGITYQTQTSPKVGPILPSLSKGCRSRSPEGTWAKAYISVAEKLCQPTLTPKKYPN